MQVLLAGAYVTILMLRTADPSVPSWAEPPPAIVFALLAYRLGDRAHLRPVPTRAQKVLAVVTIILTVLWIFAMMVLTEQLRRSGSYMLIGAGIAGFVLIMATAVCSYRARYFSWRT